MNSAEPQCSRPPHARRTTGRGAAPRSHPGRRAFSSMTTIAAGPAPSVLRGLFGCRGQEGRLLRGLGPWRATSQGAGALRSRPETIAAPAIATPRFSKIVSAMGPPNGHVSRRYERQKLGSSRWEEGASSSFAFRSRRPCQSLEFL